MRWNFLDTKEYNSVRGIVNLYFSMPTKVIQNNILPSTSESSFPKFLSTHQITMLLQVL